MTIPAFDSETGLLPPGEHWATWDEIRERLGWNIVRRRLLDGLAEGLAILSECGCSRVWLNGSFATAKEEPRDFDCVFDLTDVHRQRLELLGPELLDFSDRRSAQKRRFGGEFLPNVTEAATGQEFTSFFQTDRDGIVKGIVVIDPTKEIWE